MIGNGSNAQQILNELLHEVIHLSQYFPEKSNETITFTAGAVADTFGAWAEIVDNNAVTFSSKMLSDDSHIGGLLVEDASVVDKIYVFEIGYGASKIVVVRNRVLSGSTLQNMVQQGRRRSLTILPGETVYYRMMCETALATLRVAIRYHGTE